MRTGPGARGATGWPRGPRVGNQRFHPESVVSWPSGHSAVVQNSLRKRNLPSMRRSRSMGPSSDRGPTDSALARIASRCVPVATARGNRVQLPRGSLRGVPPRLIPDVLQRLVCRTAGAHEADLPGREGGVEVEPPGHDTVREMGPYVVLGEDGEGIVADVDAVSCPGVERLPRLVYRGAVKGCLKSFEAPALVIGPSVGGRV